MTGRRTASDPFSDEANPFTPGGNEAATTPDFAEPSTDAPPSAQAPEAPAETTKPRGGQATPSVASRSATMKFPIRCMACGNTGTVSSSTLAKASSGRALRCDRCRSTDLDLDTAPKTASGGDKSAERKTAGVLPNGTRVHVRTDVYRIQQDFDGEITGGNYSGEDSVMSYTVRPDDMELRRNSPNFGTTTVNPSDLQVIGSLTKAALSDAQARSLASAWHDGQGSALYAFASSGAILDGLDDDIKDCLAIAQQSEPADVPALRSLLDYVRERGPLRGPQPGWSDKWDDNYAVASRKTGSEALQALYTQLSPAAYDALVVGGHDPLWLAQQVVEDPADIALLKEIARMERAEDLRSTSDLKGDAMDAAPKCSQCGHVQSDHHPSCGYQGCGCGKFTSAKTAKSYRYDDPNIPDTCDVCGAPATAWNYFEEGKYQQPVCSKHEDLGPADPSFFNHAYGDDPQFTSSLVADILRTNPGLDRRLAWAGGSQDRPGHARLMTMRTCDTCGAKVGPFQPRQRNAKTGARECSSCARPTPRVSAGGFINLAEHTWAEGPDGDIMLRPGHYTIAAIDGHGTWVEHEGTKVVLGEAHVASEDYPVLGDILVERPPLERQGGSPEEMLNKLRSLRQQWQQEAWVAPGTQIPSENTGPKAKALEAEIRALTQEMDRLGIDWYGLGGEGHRRVAADERPVYMPFCSLECNRKYSGMVVLPDTENNMEPYCLNCGKPVPVWEGKKFKASRTAEKQAWSVVGTDIIDGWGEHAGSITGDPRFSNDEIRDALLDLFKAEANARARNRHSQVAAIVRGLATLPGVTWDDPSFAADYTSSRKHAWENDTCPTCDGTGRIMRGTEDIECQDCRGTGKADWPRRGSSKVAGQELVAVDDLKEGDLLASGSKIIGYLSLVRGGAQYAVLRSDGTEGTVVFDRRRKVQVVREGSRRQAAWDPAWDEESVHAYRQKAQGYPDERCARCGNLSPAGTPLVVVRKGEGTEGSTWSYETFHPSCFREQYPDAEIHATASRKHAHDSGDGETIYHCFGGETKFWTRDGLRRLDEVAGTSQMVLTSKWNDDARSDRFGGRWVEAEIKSFGEQPLLSVTFSRNGIKKVVRATAEHRWLVRAGDKRTRNRMVVTADLKPGDRMSFLFPKTRIARTTPSPVGIMAGLVFGDGTRTGAHGCHINLWGEKDAQMLRYFPEASVTTPIKTPNGVEGVRVLHLPNAFKELPDLDESMSYLYGWLAGYFAADGCVGAQGNVALNSSRLDHLEFVQHVATLLGIGTFGITTQMRVGYGTEETPLYGLEFVGSTLRPNFFLIQEHRDRYEARDYAFERLGWVVESVEDHGEVEEVFCAVVPDTESFVLDGNLWTLNCPFCGSGNVVGRSDGTAECAYCFSGETRYLTWDGVRTLKETVGTTQLVLASESFRTRIGKGPSRRGFPGLTSEQVVEIRDLYATGDITKAELARQFGVTQGSIKKIVDRKSYAHIGGGGVDPSAPPPQDEKWGEGHGTFGGRWVEAEIKSFGVQPLLRVTVQRQGVVKEIHATAEHRWWVHPSFGAAFKNDQKVTTTTTHLHPGDRLAALVARDRIHIGYTPTTPSPFGIVHGFVFGDGSVDGRGGSRVTLWGDKDQALLPYFSASVKKDAITQDGVEGKTISHLPRYFKDRPPLGESLSYLYGWLAGYFAADGSVGKNGVAQLACADLDTMEFVQMVCSHLGIGTYSIRESWRKGYGPEETPLYSMSFVASTLTPEFFVIPEHRSRFLSRRGDQDALGWTVVSVEETDRVEEVFCAVVPGYENFTLEDGINVMNCNTVFTVQVQPQHPNMPQTVNGQPYDIPGMPGEIDKAPPPGEDAGADNPMDNPDPGLEEDPGQPPSDEPPAEDTTGANPFAKGSARYITAEGIALPEDAYVRHLAIKHGGRARTRR